MGTSEHRVMENGIEISLKNHKSERGRINARFLDVLLCSCALNLQHRVVVHHCTADERALRVRDSFGLGKKQQGKEKNG